MVALAIFALTFTIYLTCFGVSGKPLAEFWVYGADNATPSLRTLHVEGEKETYEAVYQAKRGWDKQTAY